MDLQIACTPDGIKRYPNHSHNHWEIMLYTEGNGYMYTQHQNIPFKPGTIILIPPRTIHASVSENGFKNISVGGNFKNSIFFDKPIAIDDNADKDGTALAMLLFKNKKSNTAYINSIANTYIHFLLNRIKLETHINSVINEIIDTISKNFYDANISISEIIGSYNYTKDYIRQQFKKATNMHPTAFLTKCRIEQATFLIDVYGSTIPLTQIAEECGYLDYVYFSKQFKALMHISPQQYRNTLKSD